VLANTRARWRFVVLEPSCSRSSCPTGRARPWPFILGFAGVSPAQHAMLRVAAGREFRAWHAHADMEVGAAMISAILYAVGPTGHLLYIGT